MMHKKYVFEAVIKESSQGNGAWVVFPYDVKEAYSHNGMVKVEATFDGYRYQRCLSEDGAGVQVSLRRFEKPLAKILETPLR